MPDKLSQFLDDVANAKAEGDAADRSVVARLKGLSPADFARVPREILSGLSNARYADIVGSIAPDVTLPASEPLRTIAPRRQSLRIAATVSWIPRAVVAVMAALTTGMVILLIAVNIGLVADWWSSSQPLVRSVEVQTWPACPRLDRWTDGCIYDMTKGLSWRQAAHDLDLPESYLRRLNRHISDDPISTGASLIVWRERFPLQEKK
jgi:hypothetical protein